MALRDLAKRLKDYLTPQTGGLATSVRNWAQNTTLPTSQKTTQALQDFSGRLGNVLTQVKSAPQELTPFTARQYLGGGNLPEPVTQFRGASMEPLSFGLIRNREPEPTTTAGKIARIGGTIAGSIPAFGGAQKIVTGSLANAARLPLAGQIASEAVVGALGMGLTSPGGIKERLKSAGQGFTPENIAMGAIFPIAGTISAKKQFAKLVTKEIPVKRALMDIQNLDILQVKNPTAWMSKIENMKKLAEETMPDVVNSRYMKSIENSDVKLWANHLGSAWRDRMEIATGKQIPGMLEAKAIGGKNSILEAEKAKGLTPEVTTAKPITKLKGETPKPIEPILKTQAITEIIQPQPQIKISSKGILTPPATGTGRRAPQEINVSRLDLNKKQRVELQKQTAKTVKDTLSNDEIKRIAESAGFDTKTYTTEQTAQKIAEQLNVRRQVVELENQLSALRKAKAKPEVIAAQLKKIADQAEITTKQGTDIARQLQARRILANEIDTPMQKMFKILDEAGVNRDVYVKKAAKEGIDFNNAQQSLKFYRELVPAKAKDWIDLVRYNSMLSSPNTFINNLSSNLQGTGIIAPIEKTITGLVDKLYSGITGKPRQYFTGEGAAYAKGYYGSLDKATKSFLDVMRGTDTELGSSLDVRQAPLATTGIEKKIYEHLSYPMKLLEGTDKFFQTLTKAGSEASLNYKINKGIKLKINPEDLALQEAKKRLFISELGQNEGSKALDAIDFFANLVQRAKGSKNPIVSNMAKFTLPFVRTPTNILKQGLEYSPLGVTTLWGSQHKTEQIAKALMGTSVGVAAATLLANDRISWAEPTSEKQRNAFRAAGMQPYAVKIGDNWVSYAKLHPSIAFPLAMVAAVKNAQDNKRITESEADTVLNGLSKWVNFFVDQSYVKSIGDMVSGLKGSAEDLSRIPSNYLQQMIPWRALASWITRLIDPVQRQADKDGSILDKQLQQIASQIPLLSYSVPARTDQLGEPIKNTNNVLNAFSPFGKITTENPEKKQQYLDIMEKSRLTKQKADIKSMLEQGKDITGLEVNAVEIAPKVGMSKDQLDIAKLRFELSNQQAQDLGNGVYFTRNDAGNASVVDISKEITEPEYTGVENIDKKLKSGYKGDLTKRGNDIIKLYENGLINLEQATALMDEIEIKYDATKAPKKAKKITLKSVKVNLPGVSKTQRRATPTFKAPALPNIKIAKSKKPKSIKVSSRKAPSRNVRISKSRLYVR